MSENSATQPATVNTKPRACPVGTPWCREHLSEDGGEQCVSRYVDISPQVSVWLTQEPGMGAPVVAIDAAASAELPLDVARGLAEAVTALVDEVGR